MQLLEKSAHRFNFTQLKGSFGTLGYKVDKKMSPELIFKSGKNNQMLFFFEKRPILCLWMQLIKLHKTQQISVYVVLWPNIEIDAMQRRYQINFY